MGKFKVLTIGLGNWGEIKNVWVAVGLMLSTLGLAGAQVVPDGGTATTVTTDAGGKVTVTIAPPNSSQTSLNTYTDFNVSRAGVVLDNAVADARTIVNEVTSNKLSNINGTLTVVGSDAHVIVANPNGVVVNGGEFINTGGVALVAATMSENVVMTGPGISDIQPVASTSAGGFIRIEGSGMKGDMTQVLLAAETVKIDDKISFADQLVGQNITVYGGTNDVQFNSAVAASNTLLPWYDVTDKAGDVSGVAIDITDQANIIGGSISLIVNDAGAGVRSAGDMTSDAGNILIKTNAGRVELNGGTIAASGDMKISGSEIIAKANVSNSGVIQALSGDVQITSTSGDIHLANYQVGGAAQDTVDTASLGGVTLVSAKDILLYTDDPSITTLVTTVADGMHLQAVGDITNNTSQIVATTGNITIWAGDAFNNIVDVTPTTITETGAGIDCFLVFCFGGTQYTADFGTLRLPSEQAYVTASSGDIIITADKASNFGSSLIANDGGDINITTASGFMNEAVSSGQVSVGRNCFLLFCSGNGSSNQQIIGGQVAANGMLTINGGTNITNTGGTLFGDGGVDLTADEIGNLGIDFISAVERPSGVKGLSGWFGGSGKSGFSYTQKTGGIIGSGEGSNITFNTTNVVTNTNGQIIAGGEVVASNDIETVTTEPFFGPVAPEPIGLFENVLGGISEKNARLIVLYWPMVRWFF